MTLTLDMTPELDRRLREAAARKGISAEECARMLLEEGLLNGPRAAEPGAATSQDRKRRLSRWIEANRGLPSLPEEAFRRASF
jgi:plasmid stability protein